ncbi:MAG: helix-turn-helix domain-containing protein [Rhodobacteraceae bacterium]|nr:helix-turn-helix domain-containing protein [Paracoccaceae bacterium]
MAKRINPSRIKKNLTYTTAEAAEELDISIATIRNWIKQGLPIEKGQRPFLLYGIDLRDFITAKTKSRKFTLPENELNCFACKAGRKPLNSAVTYTTHTAKTGRLNGICSACGGMCSRIISNAKISVFSEHFKIHFNGDSAP